MASNKGVKKGDRVVSADGKDVGRVNELGNTCFKISAKRRDFWLANDALKGRSAGVALLRLDNDRLNDAAIDTAAHRGPHSHQEIVGASRGNGVSRPLLILAGAGLLALRDRERRQKALSAGRQGLEYVKSKVSRESQDSAHEEMVDSRPGYSTTNTFASPSTTSRQRTRREEAVVEEVTQAFPDMTLSVTPVAVHKLEGGQVQTLRFTLDDMVSSDLELERLEHSREPERILAAKLIQELKSQLPTAER